MIQEDYLEKVALDLRRSLQAKRNFKQNITDKYLSKNFGATPVDILKQRIANKQEANSIRNMSDDQLRKQMNLASSSLNNNNLLLNDLTVPKNSKSYYKHINNVTSDKLKKYEDELIRRSAFGGLV